MTEAIDARYVIDTPEKLAQTDLPCPLCGKVTPLSMLSQEVSHRRGSAIGTRVSFCMNHPVETRIHWTVNVQTKGAS